MKRFYKNATVTDAGGSFAILLDGRGIKTPARSALAVPTRALAEAIADEWRAQGEKIDPRSMPLTGLANAALDSVAPAPTAFAAELARYAESDLLLYRAGDPASLVEAEAAAWDPLLAWAQARFDVRFTLATGIIHRAQPPETVHRLAAAVSALDAFRLAGLSPLVTIGGSLIAALAVLECELTADPAFDATHLDERWQAERWGEDALATRARDRRREDFNAAARFLSLLR